MGAKPGKRSDRNASSIASRPGAAHERACTLPVKAIPNAPRNEVAGWLGDALKLKIHAPPVEGKANDELCAFLAVTLGLPVRAITVARGDTSRHKLVRITGMSLADVKARLAAAD